MKLKKIALCVFLAYSTYSIASPENPEQDYRDPNQILKTLNIYQNGIYQYNEYGPISKNNHIKYNNNELYLDSDFSDLYFSISEKYPFNITYTNLDDASKYFNDSIGKEVFYKNNVYVLDKVKNGSFYLSKNINNQKYVTIVNDFSTIDFPINDKDLFNIKMKFKENINPNSIYTLTAFNDGINWTSDYQFIIDYSRKMKMVSYLVIDNNTTKDINGINSNLVINKEEPVQLFKSFAMKQNIAEISSVMENNSPSPIEEIYRYKMKNIDIKKGKNYYIAAEINDVKYKKYYEVNSYIQKNNKEETDKNLEVIPYYDINLEQNQISTILPQGKYKILVDESGSLIKIHESTFPLLYKKDNIKLKSSIDLENKVKQKVVYKNEEISYNINIQSLDPEAIYKFKINIADKNIEMLDYVKDIDFVYDKYNNTVRFELKGSQISKNIFKFKINENNNDK